MLKTVRALLAAIACASVACGDAEPGARAPDAAVREGGGDATLDWTNGGADTPEYSLGRLLISHAAAAELTLFDLDTSTVAGRIPFAARAEVEAGASGRYGYAFRPDEGRLHVIDPGQWLLSHIDHFHVVRGEHQLMAEQVDLPMLTSLRAHDGWITSYAAGTGTAALFQERSITARSFAPAVITLGKPSTDGVALVSRAQLIASDGTELSQRSVLAPDQQQARFAGCSAPRGIAAHGERVFVGCAEGLLQLSWDPMQELFVPELLAVGEPRVLDVRTGERLAGAAVQLGARTIGLVGARGAALRRVELGSDLVALQLRRQGNVLIALTVDGVAHELDLQTVSVTRSTPVLTGAALDTRMVLSHAYAYIADPQAPRVLVLRLRTMQLEPELTLSAPAHDLALVGVPGTYTDDRE
jgi:hypothetical protein